MRKFLVPLFGLCLVLTTAAAFYGVDPPKQESSTVNNQKKVKNTAKKSLEKTDAKVKSKTETSK
jgi:hypothetical protein